MAETEIGSEVSGMGEVDISVSAVAGEQTFNRVFHQYLCFRTYYHPGDQGLEKRIKERLEFWKNSNPAAP